MPYYPLSGYTIDGYDIFGTWRIKVERITGLYSFLNRKGDLSQSWLDSDGEDPFNAANDIYFEGRDIVMFCNVRSTSFAVMRGQLTLFEHRLQLAGNRTLVVPYHGTTFSLMYVRGSDLDMLTPKTKTNLYMAKFWVQFRETTPVRS